MRRIHLCSALLSALLSASFAGCGKSEPPAPTPSYPDVVEVVAASGGGPGIRQRITPEFKKRIDPKKDWQTNVKLVAFSMLLNSKTCDQLDALIPFAKTNYAAFRVSCLDDKGQYRVYLMQKRVDEQHFSVEFWRD